MPALLKALQHAAKPADKTFLRLTRCRWLGRGCGRLGRRSFPRPPSPPLLVTCAASSAASPIINGLARLPPGTAEPNTLSRTPMALFLCLRNSPSHRVVNHQHDDRADNGNHHAVKIKTGDPAYADGAEEETSDDCSDNAKNDVHKQTLAGFVYDLAADEPGDKP